MSDDEVTLVGDYKFEWDDGTTRRTSDEDAFDFDPTPELVEILAEQGRQDDECEVTLMGMAG